MNRRNGTRREFHVVQFIDLPFEGIGDYVCVPYTWLVIPKATNNKAFVAYPNDEDPQIKDRVKRKERYKDEWRFYKVTVKYESNSYSDAELWIATRNEYGPLVEEESKVTGLPLKRSVNKQSLSAIQNSLSKSNNNLRKPLPTPAKSESKKEIDVKLLKLNESAQSSSGVVNDAKVEPRSSKRKQYAITQDTQSKECSQTETSSVALNADESTEPRSKTPRTEHTKQVLSSPVEDVDKRTEVNNIDEEDQSQRVKKLDENKSMSQTNSSSNTTDVSMTAAKSSTAAEQITQPNQYNLQEYIPDRKSLSNSQPQIENVQAAANVDENKLLVNEDSSQKLLTSHEGFVPLKMSAQLYSHMNGCQRLIPISSVEKRLRPEKMESLSNLKDQYLPTNQDKFQQEQFRSSRESNTYDHRPTSQTIKMRIPSIIQNSTCLSNPTHQTPELAENRQMQPNQMDSQQHPQRPKLRIGISIKPKDRKHMQELSTTHNNLLLNNPQLQARTSPRSTGNNNVDLTTCPQNIIASEASDRQNTERPSRPIHPPSRIQHTTAHENGCQNLCTQEQLFDQSTATNIKTKRGHFMNDAASSSVTGSHRNVMGNACQPDECMVDQTLSPYHGVTSDSDAVTDREEISDSEMSDELPVETTNYVYGTANDPGYGSADRPSAAQSSTSRNHQRHPKVILEQQMLDNFAILFTQMGATLRYTTDMYNNLRSSILDTAQTYKKLLGAVEQFNTVVNTASNASPSSNLRPESPRSPGARHTIDTESATSSNQDQHTNDIANRRPNQKRQKFRFVLPPEYNAYDTRWTLKYPTNLPGLVELVPQSGVYVSYGELQYCQQVSKDCKSLARRLLTEVFSRNALSVCSTMSEKAQASNNVGSNIRPDLDDGACSVLLHFVLEHGLQRGWNTDLQPILSTVHSKMQEIRFKYGVMVEC